MWHFSPDIKWTHLFQFPLLEIQLYKAKMFNRVIFKEHGLWLTLSNLNLLRTEEDCLNVSLIRDMPASVSFNPFVLTTCISISQMVKDVWSDASVDALGEADRSGPVPPVLEILRELTTLSPPQHATVTTRRIMWCWCSHFFLYLSHAYNFSHSALTCHSCTITNFFP